MGATNPNGPWEIGLIQRLSKKVKYIYKILFSLQEINGGTVMILKSLAQISMTLTEEVTCICFARCEMG